MLSFNSFLHFTVGFMPLLAQTADVEADPAASGFGLVMGLISYLVIAFFSWKIFEKCGIANPWFAWIPVLNNYAAFQAGDEENPLLWTILSLIPCVNIIAVVKLIMAWIKICQKLGKSPWLLLLCLIPPAIFFVFGYLAFA